ncbi:MAG: nucleoside hydrolase [Canibacter sp.]
MATPVIIDTDPGIDDAIAIMLAAASPEVDIRGIVAVAGNVGLEHTAQNATALADLLGLDVPVGRGASGPLRPAVSVTAADVHGANGFGGYELPHSDRVTEPGVSLLARLIRESPEPPIVVAIGPLTNLALLINEHPDAARCVSRFVIMGGGTGEHLGNITPAAEFNLHADPDAAAAVFAFGIPITMVGLNVTEQTTIGATHLPELWKSRGPVAHLTHHLLSTYRGTAAADGTAQHDSAAMAAVIAPELVTTVQRYVAVETRGEFTSGMTVIDHRDRLGYEPNCDVAVDINLAGFRELMHERLTALDQKLSSADP